MATDVSRLLSKCFECGGNTMKAMLLRETGAPENMRLEDVATPQPGPGEVLVKVEAVSVNRTLDLKVREGAYVDKAQLPHVLGSDPGGTIAAIGDGVTDRKIGDRVVCGPPARPSNNMRRTPGVHIWGGYAEYIKLPADATRLIPDGMDFNTAVVVARHGPIAFNQLRNLGGVKEGDWVLIMGASGGIGSMAVQFAKMFGARVIAGAGSDERVSTAMALGADAGINYGAQDLEKEVRGITDNHGADIVLENISDPVTFTKAFASLARGGRLITAGTHGGGLVQIDINTLYLKSLRIIGGLGAPLSAYEASMQAARDGRLKVNIQYVLPLREAARAHHLVADRKTLGKVLLSPTLDA